MFYLHFTLTVCLNFHQWTVSIYRPCLKCAWWIFFIALFLVWFCLYHHCFSSFACVFLFAGDADTKWLLPIQVRENRLHHGRSRNLISCYFIHTLQYVFLLLKVIYGIVMFGCALHFLCLYKIFVIWFHFLKAQWLLYACISCTCIPVLNLIQWYIYWICVVSWHFNIICILKMYFSWFWRSEWIFSWFYSRLSSYGPKWIKLNEILLIAGILCSKSCLCFK